MNRASKTLSNKHMNQPIYQVNAFTDRAFGGNPAAVCPLESARDAQWMQNVAMEMNLAETAFLVRRADGSYDLRWFTPIVEVDLCGHATLASAHALWESHRLDENEPARFHTRSGPLTCTRRNDGWVEMDFPATPAQSTNIPAGLLESLGVTAADVQTVEKSKFDYLLHLRSEQQLRALAPDHSTLRRLPVRGIIVTAAPASKGQFDFISRFFAPGSGIDEDPATGSAHCCLAAFWRERLGKDRMLAFQASKRGGVVSVTLRADRVLLAGQAVTTLRGELIC
jgi:PhzF family phenazine biosynthesis protein